MNRSLGGGTLLLASILLAGTTVFDFYAYEHLHQLVDQQAIDHDWLAQALKLNTPAKVVTMSELFRTFGYLEGVSAIGSAIGAARSFARR